MKTKHIKIRRRGEEKTWEFKLNPSCNIVNEPIWTWSEAYLNEPPEHEKVRIKVWFDYSTQPWDFELVEMWNEGDVEIPAHIRLRDRWTKCDAEKCFCKGTAPIEEGKNFVIPDIDTLIAAERQEQKPPQPKIDLSTKQEHPLTREDKLDEARKIVRDLYSHLRKAQVKITMVMGRLRLIWRLDFLISPVALILKIHPY